MRRMVLSYHERRSKEPVTEPERTPIFIPVDTRTENNLIQIHRSRWQHDQTSDTSDFLFVTTQKSKRSESFLSQEVWLLLYFSAQCFVSSFAFQTHLKVYYVLQFRTLSLLIYRTKVLAIKNHHLLYNRQATIVSASSLFFIPLKLHHVQQQQQQQRQRY